MISLIKLNPRLMESTARFIPINLMREALDENELSFYSIKNDGEIIGAIVSENSGDTCILRYIELDMDMQNKGFGTQAIEAFILRSTLMDYSKISCKYIPKINPGFDNIITNLKADKYNLPYGMHSFSLDKLLSRYKNKDLSGQCKSLSSLGPIELKTFTNFVMQKTGYGISLPIDENVYDMECSAVITENSNCLALILIEKELNGEHYIRLLYNDTDKASYIHLLIKHAAIKGEKLYGKDAVATAISSDEDICHSLEILGQSKAFPFVEAEINIE